MGRCMSPGMSTLLKTTWRHKSGQIQGKVIDLDPHNGRVVLKLDDGRVYRGRVNNLKAKWTQIDG